MKLKNFWIFCLGLLFLNISCTIGLGESVDTETPVVTINSPAAGAIIRGDFAIAGTWSDDGLIDKIEITLEPVVTDSTLLTSPTVTYQADFESKAGSSNTNWKKTISPSSFGILDGTYLATVEIEDKYGHTSTSTRQFTIDNTSPVIILQRPSTPGVITSAKPDAYGQVLTLEGQAADDNNIHHITIDFYATFEEGILSNKTSSVTISNVPLSIALDVAKWRSQTYYDIYGSKVNEGAKTLYCEIHAYDSAQYYPSDGSKQSTEDTFGNCTTFYYLYDDIYSAVLSNYKVTDLYHIKSGTYDTSSRSADSPSLSSVKETLNANIIKVGSFVLDPTNNPTFTVTGKNKLGENESLSAEDYSITNGSDVTIEISPGLDNYPIVYKDSDDLKIYALESDKEGNVIDETKKIYLSNLLDSYTPTKTGSNYKYTVNLNLDSGLKIGKYYVFGVEGQDESGNSIMPDDGGIFGFCLAASGNAPDIKVNGSPTLYAGKDRDLVISGYTKIPDSGLPILTITDDDDNVWLEYEFTEADLRDGSRTIFDFEKTIPYSELKERADNKSSTFTLTITSNIDGNKGNVYRNVIFDIQEPEIQINTVSPLIQSYNGAYGADSNGSRSDGIYYTNGLVEVSGILSDVDTTVTNYTWQILQGDSIDSLTNVTKEAFVQYDERSESDEYLVEDSSDSSKNYVYEKSSVNVKFKFDTNKIEDKKITAIKITAYDMAGNESTSLSYSSSTKVKDNLIYLFVDQTTDKPTFQAQDGKSWKSGIVNPNYINQYLGLDNEVNVVPQEGNLYVKLTDDDGLKKVYTKIELVDSYEKSSGTDSATKNYILSTTSPVVDSESSVSGVENSISLSMPNDPGFYLVTLRVEDSEFSSESLTPSHYREESFLIRVKGNGATITLTRDPDSKYIRTADATESGKTKLTIKLNIDGEKPYKITRSYYMKNDNGDYVVTSKILEENWQDNDYPDEFDIYNIGFGDDREIKYTVVDLSGSSASKSLKFTVDNDSPTISVTYPNKNASFGENAHNGKSATIRASVSDKNDSGVEGSGVKTIYYAFTDISETKAPSSFYKQEATSGTQNLVLNLESGKGTNKADTLFEGNYKLWIKAEDVAQNMSNYDIYTFSVDQAPPSIEYNVVKKVQNPDDSYTYQSAGSDDSISLTDSNIVGFKLKGTVSDVNGIKEFTIDGNSVAFDDGKWQYPQADDEYITDQRTYKYTIVAEDNSGTSYKNEDGSTETIDGKKTEIHKNVLFDTEGPVITINLSEDSDGNYWFIGSGNTYLSGTANDGENGSGLKSLLFKIDDTESVLPVSEEWQTKINLANYTEYTDKEKNEHTIKITASDYAGNESSKEIQIRIDTSEPTVDGFTADKTYISDSSYVTFTGSAFDGLRSAQRALKSAVLKATKKVSATTEEGLATESWEDVDINSSDNPGNDITLSLSSDSSDFGAFTQTLNGSSLDDGEYRFIVTTTDIAGRTSDSAYVTVKVDKTEPSSDGITITTSNSDASITIDGTPYELYNTSSLDLKLKNVIDTSSITNGIESGLSGVEISNNASDNASDTNPTWSALTKDGSDYKGTITGLTKQGINTITAKATDNAGNVKQFTKTIFIDTNEPDTLSLVSIQMGTDEAKSGITSKLVNNSKDATFVLTVKDANSDTENASSGIKSVKLTKIGSTTLTSPITASLVSGDNYQIKVPAATICDGALTIEVYDNANNKVIKNDLFTFIYDNNSPTITLSAITDADTSTPDVDVNGTFKVSGTASDTTASGSGKVTSLELQWATSSTADSWTTIVSKTSESGFTSWSFDVDSRKVFVDSSSKPLVDGSSIYLRVSAKDEIGNTSTSAASKVILNQDSDRPIITLTNADLSASNKDSNYYWHSETILYFTISDDDGSITSTSTDGIVQISEDNKNFTSVEYNSVGTYTFTSNGSKTIYFKVRDNDGKTFTSNTASTTFDTFGPKILDKNKSNKLGYTSSDDIVYLKVDTQNPIIDDSKVYYQVLSSSATLSTDSYAEDNLNNATNYGWKNIGEIFSDKIGGPDTVLYVMYRAADANGISSSTLKLASTTADEFDSVEVGNTSYWLTDSAGKSIPTKLYIKKIIINNDSSVMESGSASLEITAQDNAKREVTKTYQTTIDNTGPVITYTSHSADAAEKVYGSVSVEVRASLSDAQGSAVNKRFFAISLTDSEPSLSDFTDITEYVSGASSTCRISFDGSEDENTEDGTGTVYHLGTLNSIMQSKLGKTDDEFNDYETETPMYIWLYNSDKLGNISDIAKLQLNVIPQGDKPSISIIYPESGQGVGGTIRVTGSTEITTNKVDSVWLMIDPSYNGSTFDDDGWASELQTLMTAKGVSSYSITDEENLPAALTNLGIKKAIRASGSVQSWNKVLNENKEFNDKVENSNRVIAVKAYAVSNTNKSSEPVISYFTIDPDNPLIGNEQELTLVQYETSSGSGIPCTDGSVSSGNIAASQKYKADMYIKGIWFLTGSITDESGIRKIVYTDSDGNTKTFIDITASTPITSHANVSKLSETAAWTEESENQPYYNYKINIPVGSTAKDSFGNLTYSIEATEGGKDSTNATTESISINYDNKNPAFTCSTLNADVDNEVSQYKGTYSLEGSVKEPSSGSNSQSGFERLAVFFTRDLTVNGTTTTYLIDPMVDSGDDGTSNRYIAATTVSSETTINSAFTKSAEGLFWRSAEATLANGNELTTDSALPSNVRIGGLCKFKNVIYRIDGITNNTVYLSDNVVADSDDNGSKQYTVYFAFAQVVDNSVGESGTTGLYDSTTTSSINYDDGDQMVEQVKKNGTTYDWNCAIDSSNILDGPITIHFVAFDKSGNYFSTSYDGTVKNNPVRLVGVRYGTDKNGNGSVDESEYIDDLSQTYSVLAGLSETNLEARKVESIEIENRLTVKGNLTVYPQLVGGNKNLSYTYTYTQTVDSTSTEKTTAPAILKDSSNNDAGHSSDLLGRYDSDKSYNIYPISITSSQFVDTLKVVDGNQILTFTIWDHTEGKTVGVNSNKATVILPVNIAIIDGIAPSVELDEFYWKSASENCLYNNSSSNGHIELSDELPEKFKENSGLYDKDPKVSGIITFNGRAKDNVIVTEILAKIPGYNSGKAFTLASRQEDGSWSSTKLISDTSAALSGWGIKIGTETTDENDYDVVPFSFFFDTSSIDSIAKTDVEIQFTAKDKGSGTNQKTSAESKTSTLDSAKTSMYKVDVVPYITKIYTKLARNKTSNWSVYNRTALGHYPVQSVVSNIDSSITLKTSTSEDVVIYGFNLNDSSATFTSGSNTFKVGGSDELKIDNSTAGQLSFNVAKLQTGELNLTVNGVSILNNENNNDAAGDASEAGDAYKNWYNRQGNGDTNNILTDDVYFDVWEFNDRAATPINGLATGINMEINQKTGMLNYAFANGGLYYSMGGNSDNKTEYSTDNSYSSIYWAGDWDTFAGPCVGFHVDELGYTYSLDSGGDTNKEGSVDKWVLYSSRWGLGKHDNTGTLNGTNSLRLEEIALKTGAGTYDYSLMKYRFLSPEFASTVSGTSTNLYLVYYDALTNQIRFRAGTFTKTEKEQTGGFQDEYTKGESSYYKTNNCQVIANGTAGATFKTSATKTTTVSGIEGRGSGQYVDVAVVKNGTADVVCVVWYDVDDNKCKFSYITDPIADWNNLKGDDTAEKWSTPQPIFTEGGEYCHIVADKNNHLHIAAYAGNGDVMYAYLDTYTSTPSTCVVDASGSVGEHLTLDVAVNSKGHSIPYIGYYTGAIKKPKYAYLVDPTIKDSTAEFNPVAAGADDYERYTGAWEVAVVPTPSIMTTNREDKVNIGVWKNSGVLTDSKVGGAVKNSSHSPIGSSGYSATNWSKTFGNGTSNGILGYQITTSSGSCLETAQMR